MTSAFQPTKHLFSKINEAILDPNSHHIQLAATYVCEIVKSVKEFTTGLEERGEPDFHIYHIYEDLEKFLQCLIVYFQNGSEIRIPRIYAGAVERVAQGHVEEINTIVENYDIDGEIRIPRIYVYVFARVAQGHVEELKTIAENYDKVYSQLG